MPRIIERVSAGEDWGLMIHGKGFMRLLRLSIFGLLLSALSSPYFRLRVTGRIQNEWKRFISGDVQDERTKGAAQNHNGIVRALRWRSYDDEVIVCINRAVSVLLHRSARARPPFPFLPYLKSISYLCLCI